MYLCRIFFLATLVTANGGGNRGGKHRSQFPIRAVNGHPIRPSNLFPPIRAQSNNDPECDFSEKELWLMPGKVDDSCTRPDVTKIMEIEQNTIDITPKLIRLPGCFTIKFLVRILDTTLGLPESYFGKVEYQWWNLKDFSDLKCQNSSANGCGGYGNNCYYCDICDSITEFDPDASFTDEELLDQFKGIKCPRNPGVYQMEKEFCFHDLRAFDQDGDCKMDFLQKGDGSLGYRSAFSSLQQLGFGTLVSNYRLAYNATTQQKAKKVAKQVEIERVVREEVEQRRRSWDEENGPFDTFAQWYIRYRIDLWHKNKYLPWLLYTNEAACVKVLFDVCDKRPTPVPWATGPNYKGPKLQCRQ